MFFYYGLAYLKAIFYKMRYKAAAPVGFAAPVGLAALVENFRPFQTPTEVVFASVNKA